MRARPNMKSALHLRLSLPERSSRHDLDETRRVLFRAEFDTASVEVGSKSRLVEERHGIGRIGDQLAVSERIGNEILRRNVFG